MSRSVATAQRPQQTRLLWITTLFAVLIALLFITKVALTVVERADAPVSDLLSYFDGAQRLRAGLPLYRPDFNLMRDGAYQFIYPPLLAFLLLPMPTYQVAWWCWAAFSIICWLLALSLLLRELSGDIRRRVSLVWLPVLLAALINFPPVISHLFWGQLQLLLLLILVGCWLCLRRERDVSAGVLLGLAIALKIFPALLIVPLLAQRRWSCIAIAALTALGALLLSFAAVGWDQGWYYLTRVLPDVNRALGQYSPGNNSISSTIRNAIGDGSMAEGLSLVIRTVIVSAVTFGAWRLRNNAARAGALGVTMLMLVPPVIWEHYFVLAYLPWLDALSRMRRGQGVLLGLAYFLIASASLAYHTPDNWIPVVQALPLAGALLLLGVQLQQALGQPAQEIVVAVLADKGRYN
jgi:alpha-1,2-mannosyltransferase